MTKIGRGWAERAAVILAVMFVVALGLIEVAIYRPQRHRLRAAEDELHKLQTQLAGVARVNLADEELLRYAGTAPDGRQFRNAYSSDRAVMYLTDLLMSSGMSRQDFKTEGAQRDGPFRIDRFYIVLKGPYSRALAFMKKLEGGKRLVRIEQFKMEPILGSSDVVLTVRAAVFGVPANRQEQP